MNSTNFASRGSPILHTLLQSEVFLKGNTELETQRENTFLSRLRTVQSGVGEKRSLLSFYNVQSVYFVVLTVIEDQRRPSLQLFLSRRQIGLQSERSLSSSAEQNHPLRLT